MSTESLLYISFAFCNIDPNSLVDFKIPWKVLVGIPSIFFITFLNIFELLPVRSFIFISYAPFSAAVIFGFCNNVAYLAIAAELSFNSADESLPINGFTASPKTCGAPIIHALSNDVSLKTVPVLSNIFTFLLSKNLSVLFCTTLVNCSLIFSFEKSLPFSTINLPASPNQSTTVFSFNLSINSFSTPFSSADFIVLTPPLNISNVTFSPSPSA